MQTVSVENEIDDAVMRLGYAETLFKKCSIERSRLIVSAAMNVFVEGNPRVWWLALKHKPAQTKHYPNSDGFNHLSEFMPIGTETCWFIPETNIKDMPVYEANTASIVQVLGECYGFEYNIVSKNYDWLVIETDHDIVLLVDIRPE